MTDSMTPTRPSDPAIRRCEKCGSWMGVAFANLHWCGRDRDVVIDAILSEYAGRAILYSEKGRGS